MTSTQSMESHGAGGSALLLMLMGVFVKELIVDGDSNMRTAMKDFGIPIELLAETHLCNTHFFKNLRRMPNRGSRLGVASKGILVWVNQVSYSNG